MTKNKKIDKKMQEMYSKLCVASSIKFISETGRKEKRDLKVDEKFSCNLVTMLARDKEVVAVGLKLFTDKCVVHISKNKNWNDKDVEYINKIKRYFKSISKDAPIMLNMAFYREDVANLLETIMEYCSTKFDSRVKKLNGYMIKLGSQNQHVSSFMRYIKEANKVPNGYEISEICSKYYKIVKRNIVFPEEFKRHLKKVGSYYSAFINVTVCACKEKYKNQFSNMEVILLNSVKVYQPIFSWTSVLEKVIPDFKEFEKFKKICLDNHFVLERLKEIYGIYGNKNLLLKENPRLDENIKQYLYSHVEMNILSNIIDDKDTRPVFITVSKYCCHLCELYIEFARGKGYHIFISGTHKKLYHRWVLPVTKDSAFRNDALKYMIVKLDWIIREEVKDHVSIRAKPDSEGESGDSDNFNQFDRISVNNLIKTRQKNRTKMHIFN
jgi:hypothetical protein